MNHSDADAFDVLPLLRGVCWGVIWLLTEHPYLFHRRMGCTVISDYPGIFSRHLLRRHCRITAQGSIFFFICPDCAAHWIGLTSHFVVFYVQNIAFIRMSLTSRAALCCVPVFLSALPRFIAVIHFHFSRICSDNALCRVLQNPFQFKRASSCLDSLKQTAESQRAHIVPMFLHCRKRITSVTDRNRHRHVIVYVCIQMRNISFICSVVFV